MVESWESNEKSFDSTSLLLPYLFSIFIIYHVIFIKLVFLFQTSWCCRKFRFIDDAIMLLKLEWGKTVPFQSQFVFKFLLLLFYLFLTWSTFCSAYENEFTCKINKGFDLKASVEAGKSLFWFYIDLINKGILFYSIYIYIYIGYRIAVANFFIVVVTTVYYLQYIPGAAT